MTQPITSKEKLLCQLLVSKYTKEQLLEERDYSVTNIGVSYAVTSLATKYLGFKESDIFNITTQYLNYSYLNYDKIKQKEFPEYIERAINFTFDVHTKEVVYMEKTYSLEIPGLESLSSMLTMDVKQNFFDYDAFFEDEVETDSDVTHLTIRDIDRGPFRPYATKRNVIE
jgi:hypothetical protein